MSKYGCNPNRLKLAPPKNIQRELLAHGCYIPPEERGSVSINPDVFEDFLRYRNWCKSILRKMERKLDINRKALRLAKRAYADNEFDESDIADEAEEDFDT